VPFNPDTWREGQRRVLLQAPLSPKMSFGVVTRELVTELERLGVTFASGPLRPDPEPGFEHIWARQAPQDSLAFYYDFRVGPCALRAERIVRYTMWETTLIPHEQISEANVTCALVYVPCRQNLLAHRAQGLRAPLKLLRHGVNTTRFPLLERARRANEPYTFGAVGAFSPRKGIDVLIRAFEDEFAPREHVRLLLKSSVEDHHLEPRDPRVEIVVGMFDDAGLLDILRAFDAFVQPSRGEGFGLPALEAMATGLPVIATNWSGMADFLDPDDSLPLEYTLENPGGYGVYTARFWGQWAEPSYEHLRALLRWLYEHPDDGAALGRRAAARVRRDWTWAGPARQLYDDLDALAHGITPADALLG
jgi:glycosyltransferase involved in cell wall biosynthesis